MVMEGLGTWDDLYFRRNIMQVLFLIEKKMAKNSAEELKHYQLIYVLGGMKKLEYERIEAKYLNT